MTDGIAAVMSMIIGVVIGAFVAAILIVSSWEGEVKKLKSEHQLELSEKELELRELREETSKIIRIVEKCPNQPTEN